MIDMNLKYLRKRNGLTQEQLAEKLKISRQAIAKWESGENTPDLTNCLALAKIFGVTLDDLVQYDAQAQGMPIPPKGKHLFGSVVVGERGQIVIPKKARDVFSIKSGDTLLVLGDEERGLAILPGAFLNEFINHLSTPLKEDN